VETPGTSAAPARPQPEPPHRKSTTGQPELGRSSRPGARCRVAPGPFPQAARRTRRAPLDAPGSPRSLRFSDMSGSMFVAWLVVVGLVARSTRRGSTRRSSWWRPGPRQLQRLVRWPTASGARRVRPAGMSSVPRSQVRCRRRRRRRCSPSRCRCRWRGGCEPTPPRPGGPSPRWSPRRWRSSCGVVESVPAGERAGGRQRVRLRPSRGGGAVGGLPHPGSRTAAASWRRHRGGESPK